MQSEDFRELLVKMVKACGQEVIDRAEDLVGNGDMITSFDIWLRFPTDGRMLDGSPTVEVSREYASKNAYDVFMDIYGKKEQTNA